MLQGKIFVFELVAIDREGPTTVCIKEVSSLYHKVLDHPVEDTVFETHWLQVDSTSICLYERLSILSRCYTPVFACAKLSEILGGPAKQR